MYEGYKFFHIFVIKLAKNICIFYEIYQILCHIFHGDRSLSYFSYFIFTTILLFIFTIIAALFI